MRLDRLPVDVPEGLLISRPGLNPVHQVDVTVSVNWQVGWVYRGDRVESHYRPRRDHSIRAVSVDSIRDAPNVVGEICCILRIVDPLHWLDRLSWLVCLHRVDSYVRLDCWTWLNRLVRLNRLACLHSLARLFRCKPLVDVLWKNHRQAAGSTSMPWSLRVHQVEQGGEEYSVLEL